MVCFLLSEKTPAGVVVGNLYKSTILAGKCYFFPPLWAEFEKKPVWRSFGGTILLGGGFKYFLFSPLFGEMIQFDEYF